MHNHSDSLTSYRYLVNVTGHVTIVSSRGASTYRIVPQKNLTLTIWEFNQATDVIDLTLYSALHRFQDLVITAGSIIIRLSSSEMIHIMNLEPGDIDGSNFIFSAADAKRDKSDALHLAILVLSITVPVGLMCVVAYYIIHYGFMLSAEKAKKMAESFPKRFMMMYASTLRGEYLFNATIPDKEIDEALPDWASDEDSKDMEDELLSQHTLDSHGEWIYKSLRRNAIRFDLYA